MKPDFIDAVFSAIQKLNWSYGYGDVSSVTWHGGDAAWVNISRPYMGNSLRKAKLISNRRVRFAGHVGKIDQVQS